MCGLWSVGFVALLSAGPSRYFCIHQLLFPCLEVFVQSASPHHAVGCKVLPGSTVTVLDGRCFELVPHIWGTPTPCHSDSVSCLLSLLLSSWTHDKYFFFTVLDGRCFELVPHIWGAPAPCHSDSVSCFLSLLLSSWTHNKYFFFCIPGHARSSVQWVRRSLQSAAVSQSLPKASCGHPPDWAMSGISKRQRWGRTAGCGWRFEDLCRIDVCLNGKFSVCGGGRGVDSDQFSVSRLWLELLCPAGGSCPLLSQCLGVVATPSWSCFLGWSQWIQEIWFICWLLYVPVTY